MLNEFDTSSKPSKTTCWSFLRSAAARFPARHFTAALVILSAAVAGGFTHSAEAQTSTGSISGRVLDPTKAAIPNAVVTVTNESTLISTSFSTNQTGTYTVPALQAGSYTVTIRAPHFAELKETAVSVDAGSEVRVDGNLKTESAVSSVTVVSDEGDGLTPATATISTEVPQRVLTALPYAERTSLQAATLAPGVQGDPQYNHGVQGESPSVFTQPITPGGSLAISGGRPGSASQLADGFDITLSGYPRAGVTFTGDSIQSVSVQQNALTAQYGRNGGGLINQATRQGGAKYHGLVSYRHYDPFFEAYTYGSVSPPDVHQTLWSGLISGPIPHVSKTFFMAAYEPLRARTTVFTPIRVGTPDELAGRYQNSLDLLNTTILKSQGYAAAVAAPRIGGLYYHTALNAQGFPTGPLLSVASSYMPVANNDLSAQVRQNPLALYLQQKLPTPTNPSQYLRFDHPDASYANDGTNAFGQRSAATTDDRINARVDHTFHNSDSVYLRYTRVPVNGVRYNFLGPTSVLNTVPTDNIISQNVAFGFTHIFNSASVNELRVSYLRSNRNRTPPTAELDKDYGAALGLIPAILGAGFPTLQITNTGTLGSGGSLSDGGRSLDVNFSVGDDYTLLVGKHEMKIGGEWRALQLNRTDVSNLYGGTYGFAAANTNSGVAGGSSLASFDLGLISSYTARGFQPYYYRWKYFAAYIQDAYHPTSRLTINAGLRYNLEFPRKEKNGLQGVFVPTFQNTLAADTAGAFVFSNQNGLPSTLWPVNYKGFEPRLGASYLLNKAMTVRGAYSLVHTPLTGVTNSITPDLTASGSAGGNNGGIIAGNAVDFISNQLLPITPTTLSVGPVYKYSGSSFLPYVDQSNKVPYVQLWSFGLQFQPFRQTALQVAYSGQRGIHLFDQLNPINVPSLDTLKTQITQHANFSNASITNKYDPTQKETLLQSLEPYQAFYNNPINSLFSRTASSNYNALYLSGTQIIKQQLTLIGSFTWAKSLDNDSTGEVDGTDTTIFGIAHQQYPDSLSREYSYSTFDIPVKTSLAGTWNLPLGSGQLLSTHSRAADHLIDKWTVSGQLSAQSGYPLWVLLGGPGYFISTPAPTVANPTPQLGSNGTGISSQFIRPNIVPGQPLIKANWKNDPYGVAGGGYLNAAAFTTPGSVDNPQLGNAARTLGNARNPRTIYFDASLRKSFDLERSGRFNLVLKLDVLNVMNHSNFFVNPAAAGHTLNGSLNTATKSYATNPSFGILTQANNNPGRTMAVGATLSF